MGYSGFDTNDCNGKELCYEEPVGICETEIEGALYSIRTIAGSASSLSFSSLFVVAAVFIALI